MENRIAFYEGNLLEPFKKDHQSFDIIISNPPYVTKKEYEALPKKIKDFEPKFALESGEDGLSHILEILKKAPDFLNPDGWLMIEMDPLQTDSAIENIHSRIDFTASQVIKDYSNKDRVVIARKK